MKTLSLSIFTFIAVFCATIMILNSNWGLALVIGFILGVYIRLVQVEKDQDIALEAMAARFVKDQAEYDAESDPFKDVGKPPF